jgi:hypothetical protein
MKKLPFSILVFIFFAGLLDTARAQTKAMTGLYGSGHIAVGNYRGLDLNLNYIYKAKYVLQFGVSQHHRKAASTPSNYQRGFIIEIFPTAFFLDGPIDVFSNLQLTGGKIFELNKKANLRLTLVAGVALTSLREPRNWRKNTRGGGGFGGDFLPRASHLFDYHAYNTLSIVINPKIEFPFSRFYGLSVSPQLVVNKDRTLVSIGVGHMIGFLRKKPPTSNINQR